MTTPLKPQTHYDVRARRISGTRAEKLEQIDAAIHELTEIKLPECAREHRREAGGGVAHAFAVSK